MILPLRCGTYTTTSTLTAWNGAVAEPSSSFTIEEGCSRPFGPSFTAGMNDPQAGVYSPFVTSFARQDREQRLSGFEETLPPGLLANIGSVQFCGDSEANAGACPEASRIGTVTVQAGPGPSPLSVNGTIYLMGPYREGQFGEVVEVPAIAGPFNLNEDNGAKPITVRGEIKINKDTAQATVVSDPFPQMIPGTGVPADVRAVHVILDRPGFTFNPTNCSQLSINANLTSAANTNATFSSPFHTTNCAEQHFNPKFEVSTQARTSKLDGASLTVKVRSKTRPRSKHPKGRTADTEDPSPPASPRYTRPAQNNSSKRTPRGVPKAHRSRPRRPRPPSYKHCSRGPAISSPTATPRSPTSSSYYKPTNATGTSPSSSTARQTSKTASPTPGSKPSPTRQSKPSKRPYPRAHTQH